MKTEKQLASEATEKIAGYFGGLTDERRAAIEATVLVAIYNGQLATIDSLRNGLTTAETPNN